MDEKTEKGFVPIFSLRIPMMLLVEIVECRFKIICNAVNAVIFNRYTPFHLNINPFCNIDSHFVFDPEE